MAVYRDAALVLRVTKLGEADRIVTLLTRRSGLVRAVAKGVRRTKSRFGGRLEPFSHVDVQLYAGRNLDIVTQAVTLDSFGVQIAADYSRYTAATVIAEAAGRLAAEERQPWLRLYLLVTSALRALAEPVPAVAPVPAVLAAPAPDGGTDGGTDSGTHAGTESAGTESTGTESAGTESATNLIEERLDRVVNGAVRYREPGLVLDAFLLRAMALAGWSPALRDCARCSAPGPHAAFHVASGGALCPNCRGAGFARPASATLELMGALMGGDWSTAEASEPQHRREASGLIAALTQCHLERGLKSLPLVDRPVGFDHPIGITSMPKPAAEQVLL